MASRNDTEGMRAYKAKWRRDNYERLREKILSRKKELDRLNPERVREAQRRYRESHREERAARARARYAASPDKAKAQAAAWRAANPDYSVEYRRSRKGKAAARSRAAAFRERNKGNPAFEAKAKLYSKKSYDKLGKACHQKHRVKRNEYAKRWKAANRERVRAYDREKQAERTARQNQRRAKMVPGSEAEAEAIMKVYRRAKRCPDVNCHYCERPIPLGQRHVDHGNPLSRGGLHEVGNLFIACQGCNLSKGARTAEEFMAMTKAI